MSVTAFLAISVLQGFSFGEIAIVNNNQISQLVIPKGGSPYSSGQIHIITPGQPAEIILYDYPVHTALTISIEYDSIVRSKYGSNNFVLKSLDYPNQVVTNHIGEATFKVGAILENSNNNMSYLDTNYAAHWVLTVSF